MGNQGIYSVGKEFGKTLFSFFQTESLVASSQYGLSREVLVNLTAWHDSSNFNYVFYTWPFEGYSSHEFLAS